jgi:hypothetical protein
MCHALYATMRVLCLANQNIPAMDKLHFYVCQTDANLFKYLKQASADAQLCTNTRILSLISKCDKGIDDDEDNKVLSSDNEEEDSNNSESSVEYKSNGEDIEDKENKEVPTDDEDHDVNFLNETIGASHGQLGQVHYTFIIIFSHVSIFYSPLQIDRSADLLAGPVMDSCGKYTILSSLYFHPFCMYLYFTHLFKLIDLLSFSFHSQ